MLGQLARMTRRGYISLGEIAQRLNVLVIQCDRCGRRGQYPLRKLIAKYGADASIEPLQNDITADCPRSIPMTAGEIGAMMKDEHAL